MYAKEKNDVISLNLFFLSYHITFDVDSAYDNPSVNEKNVPALNENIRTSTTDNTTFHPSHNQSSDTVNKTDTIHDYQSYDNSSSSGGSNRNLRLLLPETDRSIRKVSALAALCPTNVNPTPSKQVMTSPSPSTISINLSGMRQYDNFK